jgi:hypothetical protein
LGTAFSSIAKVLNKKPAQCRASRACQKRWTRDFLKSLLKNVFLTAKKFLSRSRHAGFYKVTSEFLPIQKSIQEFKRRQT